MNYHALTPLDAWFFRDGRPYNHAESNQADVKSDFPPPARTLTGAVRAALARANRWDGRLCGWPANVTEAFGSSPDDLGKLQFTGPFLMREKLALWPMPRHVLGRSQDRRWIPTAFLRPSAKTIETDQGKIYLPEIDGKERDGLKAAENAWITTTGLAQILAGHTPPPEAILKTSQLWKLEPRVGLKRNEKTHQVEEGDLYSPSFVRLCKGVELGIGFSGVPTAMNSLPSIFPFGGESRLAQCDSWTGNPLPEIPAHGSFQPDDKGRVKFTVTLLTPGRFDNPAQLLHPGVERFSACIGKPVPIGGWDSLKNEPLPLEPFHPAGSVWFCEALNSDFPTIHTRHGQWLGKFTEHGFGQIAIGHWPSTLDSQNKL
jgi:CRISPR-associated protein Cmr3